MNWASGDGVRRVSTSLVEGGADFIVNARMGKNNTCDGRTEARF